MIFITIIWLIVTLLASLPLCYLIWKYISERALVEVSLVDLIYKDTIIYIYFLCLIFSMAIIQCLMKDDQDQTLSYFGLTTNGNCFKKLDNFTSEERNIFGCKVVSFREHLPYYCLTLFSFRYLFGLGHVIGWLHYSFIGIQRDNQV
jgi:hypothetical protein